MPANYDPVKLKNQIRAKADSMRLLLNEAGVPQAGLPYISSTELAAANIALDEVVAHAVNHIDRNWF